MSCSPPAFLLRTSGFLRGAAPPALLELKGWKFMYQETNAEILLSLHKNGFMENITASSTAEKYSLA